MQQDTIVSAIMQKFAERSLEGRRKYGTTLDRTDLPVLAWIQHAQEEHMDAILYLEKLKQMLGGGAPAAATSAASAAHSTSTT